MTQAKKFYLSFCGNEDAFRGACVVLAASDLDAVGRAHRLGINPGGQVLMVEWDESLAGPCPYPLDRLMDAATLKSFDPTARSIREFEEEEIAMVRIPGKNLVDQ